jgi:hypothetical protein
MAVDQGKAVARKSQFTTARNKTNPKNQRRPRRASSARLERRGRQFLRFSEAVGKTVDFVEMGTAAEFPCVEIGFTDRTAFLFLMETRLTMKPAYSDWKTGDQRVLREWPPQETT